MSGAIEVFRFEGIEINVVREGDSFRVDATGVAEALGYRDAARLTEAIPDDEKVLLTRGSTVSCSRPDEPYWWLTEPGFYRAMARRRPQQIKQPNVRAAVERFQHYVFHELIPEVMRGGKVIAPPASAVTPSGVMQIDLSMASRKQIALWVIQQEEEIERLEAERDHLEPAARAWDELAEGQDHEVADAAKIISHMRSVVVGQRELFDELEALRWVYRSRSDGKWRAYQRAVRRKVLTMPAGPGSPQVRVTNKGLRELHAHYAKQGRLRLVPALPESGRELARGGES